MFCTILCCHRLWNPSQTPNVNPRPAVEISHHWKDPFTQYICICVFPKLQHYVGFCNVPSCEFWLVARRVTLVAALPFEPIILYWDVVGTHVQHSMNSGRVVGCLHSEIWWGHSNPTYCNQIRLNFFAFRLTEALGSLKHLTHAPPPPPGETFTT